MDAIAYVTRSLVVLRYSDRFEYTGGENVTANGIGMTCRSICFRSIGDVTARKGSIHEVV